MARTQLHVDEAYETTEGGLKYRLQAGFPVIQSNQESTEIREQYMMKASDAQAFFAESFPPPAIINNIAWLPNTRRMPGTEVFATRSVEFRPWSEELSWDPFSQYDDNESMDKEIRVDITYSNELGSTGGNDGGRDPNDPTTFLERSIRAGGQWLSLPPQKVRLQRGDVRGRVPNATATLTADGTYEFNGVPTSATEMVDYNGGTAANPVGQAIPDVENSKETVYMCGDPPQPSAGPCEEETPAPQETEPNRDFELPVLLPIQTVDYTFKWPLAINPNFPFMFGQLGKVNRDAHRLFFNAFRETVLFTGISAEQKFVWNGSSAVAQPWNLELQFSQRVINDGGLTYGWNHVYHPDSGEWRRLWRANGRPLHYSFSIANFFR